MTDKPEVFAVIWLDAVLGPLSLPAADAPEAVEKAAGIRARGASLVRDVRAVRIPPGLDTLETLDA